MLLLERCGLLVLDFEQLGKREAIDEFHDYAQVPVLDERLIIGDNVGVFELLVYLHLLHGVTGGLLSIL